MAFERFQDLGEEKFRKVLNLLMRGEPAMGLAKMIQAPLPRGWGLFQQVAEKTLTQQLNRLRMAAAEGAFGEDMAKRIAEGATPQVKMLEKISVRVLDRLEELSDVQRERVLALAEKEKKNGYLSAINDVSKEYRMTLLDIQKARFDLGLDEFKGPVQGVTVRSASQTTTFPDGMSVQKQVFEAVSTLEQIFDARKIPQVSANR